MGACQSKGIDKAPRMPTRKLSDLTMMKKTNFLRPPLFVTRGHTMSLSIESSSGTYKERCRTVDKTPVDVLVE